MAPAVISEFNPALISRWQWEIGWIVVLPCLFAFFAILGIIVGCACCGGGNEKQKKKVKHTPKQKPEFKDAAAQTDEQKKSSSDKDKKPDEKVNEKVADVVEKKEEKEAEAKEVNPPTPTTQKVQSPAFNIVAYKEMMNAHYKKAASPFHANNMQAGPPGQPIATNLPPPVCEIGDDKETSSCDTIQDLRGRQSFMPTVRLPRKTSPFLKPGACPVKQQLPSPSTLKTPLPRAKDEPLPYARSLGMLSEAEPAGALEHGTKKPHPKATKAVGKAITVKPSPPSTPSSPLVTKRDHKTEKQAISDLPSAWQKSAYKIHASKRTPSHRHHHAGPPKSPTQAVSPISPKPKAPRGTEPKTAHVPRTAHEPKTTHVPRTSHEPNKAHEPRTANHKPKAAAAVLAVKKTQERSYLWL